MAYKRNPLTQEIVKLNIFPSDFDNWETVSNEEIILYEQSIKIAQLNRNRNDFCLIPVEYNGNLFASTLEAKNAICYKICLLSNATSIADYYTYPQGEKIQLSKTDLKAIANLIEQREIESRDKRYNLINQINNCTTLEEIELIDITF